MSGELSKLLQQLGEQPAPQRDQEQELARARATAQRLDRQLQELVRTRRARVWRAVSLAMAAAGVLGFGGWQLLPPDSPHLAIGRENLAAPPPRPAPASPRAMQMASAEPVLAAPSAGKTRRAPGHASAVIEPEPPVPPSSSETASTLADENRLFKDAAEAARAGDTGAALRQLDELLEKYPSSQLAQTALLRKMRLLIKVGNDDAAARVAARYLDLYPSGFAANEARELLQQ